MLGQIILAQLVGQRLDLGQAFFVQGGFNAHHGLGEGKIFAALQQPLHHFGGLGRPTAVFHQRHGAPLEAAGGKMLDKGAHRRKHVGVIGGGGQHKPAVAESIGHGGGQIASGQIVHDHLGAALHRQLFRQELRRPAGMAVDGGIGNENAVAFHPIGGPGLVKPEIAGKIASEHGAVKGAERCDIQRRRFL